MTDKYGTEVAKARSDNIEGEWSKDGETYKLLCKAPTRAELEQIDKEVGETDDEDEVMARVVDEYLLKPDISSGNVELPVLASLFYGMQAAWANEVDTSGMEAQMPVEGNR